MIKNDFKLFLKKKVRVNASSKQGVELFYSGEIIRLNKDHMLFRDKFGSLVLIKYSYIVNVEEVAKENFEKVFGNASGELG